MCGMYQGLKQRFPLGCGTYHCEIVEIERAGRAPWPTLLFWISEGFQKGKFFRIAAKHASTKQLDQLAAIVGLEDFDEALLDLSRLMRHPVTITISQIDSRNDFPLAVEWHSTPLVPIEGSYVVNIFETKISRSKDQSAESLGLCFEIIDGPLVGFDFYVWLRIINAIPGIQQKARDHLDHIMRATGVCALEDSDELLDKPFKLHLLRRRFTFPWTEIDQLHCERLTRLESAMADAFLGRHTNQHSVAMAAAA